MHKQLSDQFNKPKQSSSKHSAQYDPRAVRALRHQYKEKVNKVKQYNLELS
jgi:hypothetical protein